MQFPVPQFTEVEDRIIGPLTVKQFLILLVAGGVIFFSYSLSKDYYVAGAAAVLAGIPGLIIAFAPFNGRPLYASLGIFLNYLTSPKLYVFQKQTAGHARVAVKDMTGQKDQNQNLLPATERRTKLKKIQYQLEQREEEEERLLGVGGADVKKDQ